MFPAARKQILFRKPPRVFDALRSLGLSDSLNLCLDAGHERSAPGGATSWRDVAGGGYDFFRGSDATSQASDPTFNGNPGGRSKNEFWSFDGADKFGYDSANETWMEAIHKDNANFTLAGWFQLGSSANQGLAGNLATSAGHSGFRWSTVLTSNVLRFSAYNAGTLVCGSAAGIDTVGAVPIGVPVFLATSLNEATGANGCIHQINGVQELFTSTYTSPAAGASFTTMEIGAIGAGTQLLAAGARCWSFFALNRAGTAAELFAIYQATRGAMGV